MSNKCQHQRQLTFAACHRPQQRLQLLLSASIFSLLLAANFIAAATLPQQPPQIKLLINDDELLLQQAKPPSALEAAEAEIEHAADDRAHERFNLYRSELKRLSYETIHRILRDENEPIYRREDAELRYYQKRSYQPTHEVVRRDVSRRLINSTSDPLNKSELDRELIDLDLSSQELKEFNLSEFSSLKTLNLFNNSLTQLPLDGHSQLVTLNLNKNHIKSGTAPRNLHLRALHLSGNQIERLTALNLSLLSVLETLDLSCNRIENLETAFFPQRMHNLKHLNLAHNRLGNIYRETFYNLLSLNTLLLAHNNIRDIDYETFLALPNLQHLDLSYNQLKGESIRALQGIPDLVRLSIAYNPEVGASMQEFVASWSLKELDASGTGLCQIPAALAQSVRTLKLTDNWLKIINCGDLDSYPLLQYLDLSHSHIEEIEDDALGRLEILEILFLDHNQLRKVPVSLPTSLEHLFLQHNDIMDIQVQTFQGLNSLQTLDLSGNKLLYLPPLPLPKLLTLNVQAAGLKGVSQAIVHTLPRLRDLLLEDNPIKCSDLLSIAEWASPCRLTERPASGNNNDAAADDDNQEVGQAREEDQDNALEEAKIDLKQKFVRMHNFYEKFNSSCGKETHKLLTPIPPSCVSMWVEETHERTTADEFEKRQRSFDLRSANGEGEGEGGDNKQQNVAELKAAAEAKVFEFNQKNFTTEMAKSLRTNDDTAITTTTISNAAAMKMPSIRPMNSTNMAATSALVAEHNSNQATAETLRATTEAATRNDAHLLRQQITTLPSTSTMAAATTTTTTMRVTATAAATISAAAMHKDAVTVAKSVQHNQVATATTARSQSLNMQQPTEATTTKIIATTVSNAGNKQQLHDVAAIATKTLHNDEHVAAATNVRSSNNKLVARKNQYPTMQRPQIGQTNSNHKVKTATTTNAPATATGGLLSQKGYKTAATGLVDAAVGQIPAVAIEKTLPTETTTTEGTMTPTTAEGEGEKTSVTTTAKSTIFEQATTTTTEPPQRTSNVGKDFKRNDSENKHTTHQQQQQQQQQHVQQHSQQHFNHNFNDITERWPTEMNFLAIERQHNKILPAPQMPTTTTATTTTTVATLQHKHAPLQLHIKDRHLIGTPLLMHKGQNILEQLMLPTMAHKMTPTTTTTTVTTEANDTKLNAKMTTAAVEAKTTQSTGLARAKSQQKATSQQISTQADKQIAMEATKLGNVPTTSAAMEQLTTATIDGAKLSDKQQQQHIRANHLQHLHGQDNPTKHRGSTLIMKKMTITKQTHLQQQQQQKQVNQQQNERQQHAHYTLNTPRENEALSGNVREAATPHYKDYVPPTTMPPTTTITTTPAAAKTLFPDLPDDSIDQMPLPLQHKHNSVNTAIMHEQHVVVAEATQKLKPHESLSQSEQWLDVRHASTTGHPGVVILLSFSLFVVLLVGLLHVYRCDMPWRRHLSPHQQRPHQRHFNEDDAHSFLNYHHNISNSQSTSTNNNQHPHTHIQRWHHSMRAQPPYSSPLHNLHVRELQKTSAVECVHAAAATAPKRAGFGLASAQPSDSSRTSSSLSSTHSMAMLDADDALYVEITAEAAPLPSDPLYGGDMLPMELLSVKSPTSRNGSSEVGAVRGAMACSEQSTTAIMEEADESSGSATVNLKLASAASTRKFDLW